MKITFRQTLASTAGATLAALIASLFGVKGTIVGVAIGSAAATIGTALVARSIERGHDVVRQVVGTPEDPGVFRRLGDTGIVGKVTQANDETAVVEAVSPSDVAPTEGVASAEPGEDVFDDTVAQSRVQPANSAGPTPALQASSAAYNPDHALEDIGIATKSGGGHKIDWPLLAGTIGLVFVLTAICVTSIALITSYVTGNGVTNFENPGTSSTTTPTLPPASTTTSSSSSTTTSTTATTTPTAQSSTTTTTGAATTTTVPTLAPTTTTTTAPSSATSTTG